MWWATWWAWVVAGFALGVLEVIVPGYLFLGFAVGAVMTGGLIGFGILGTSLPFTILVFAVVSLGAWFALRRVLGTPEGQVKVWHKDVND
jgi:membrane protein implicated in regulation of membrane protease activity